MRVFFDTNVLVCSLQSDDRRFEITRDLLLAGGIVSVQVLNEFVNVAVRKLKLNWTTVGSHLAVFRTTCEVVPLTVEGHTLAVSLAERYRLDIYDAAIVASALLAGCSTLLSEDMHDGLVIDGLTIRNPYV